MLEEVPPELGVQEEMGKKTGKKKTRKGKRKNKDRKDTCWGLLERNVEGQEMQMEKQMGVIPKLPAERSQMRAFIQPTCTESPLSARHQAGDPAVNETASHRNH